MILALTLFHTPSQDDVSLSIAANGEGNELPDDVANRMSLFYANPTPMLNTLCGATERLMKEVTHNTLQSSNH